MTRKLLIVALVPILVFGLGPVVAFAIADQLSCLTVVGKESVLMHPCLVGGVDISRALDMIEATSWASLIAAFAFLVWLTVAVPLFVLRIKGV